MSLRVLLSFLLVSFLSISFGCTCIFEGFWLGDRRDVQLVSYQRDLGVWMFPGVRRVGFLSAISLKMHAVFVP